MFGSRYHGWRTLLGVQFEASLPGAISLLPHWGALGGGAGGQKRTRGIVWKFLVLASNPNARYPLIMPTVALQAHYDGEHIVLDEPYDLPANASLIVTLLPSTSDADSESAWLRAAGSSDAFAFLADPAEDIYTPADGEPFRDAV